MPLTLEAQGVVDRFTQTLSAERHQNFDRTIQQSPALQAEINEAVASGRLRSFAALPPGVNAGGSFDQVTGQLQLPLSMLNNPRPGQAFNANELIFTMAHECRHATERHTVDTAQQRFDQNIERIAQSPERVHDYTGPLREMIDVHRLDEGRAHIAGFNAVVSHLRQGHPQPFPHPTLEEIYRADPMRMDQFIDRASTTPPTYALRPGLALNPDMSLPPTDKNIATVARNYFDRPASVCNVGDHGLSDYTNLYAAQYVGEIVQAERRAAPEHGLRGLQPQMGLDMIGLGLDERQLERNGLNLGPFGGSQPYLNTGQHPATECRFHHTIDSHRYIAQAGSPMPLPAPGAMQDAAHPAIHPAMHPAIQRAAQAMDRSPNIGPEAFGEDRGRVAAGIALHAAKEQLRADHVVMNEQRSGLIAVQGALGDPTARLSSPLPLTKAQSTDLSEAQTALSRLQPADAVRTASAEPVLAQRESPVLAAAGPTRC